MSVPMLCGLTALYVACGTTQTLSLKWADHLFAPDRFTFRSSTFLVSEEHNLRMEVAPMWSFAHPFTQAFFMFCAECLCLVVVLVRLAYKKWLWSYLPGSKADTPPQILVGEDVCLPCNPCVWLLPCAADFLASIMQNVGLILTYASVYQMLRGATMIWMALLSFVWLRRRFTRVELWGMGSVVLGLTLVGLSSVLTANAPRGAARSPLVGNVLIMLAQVLHAYQGVCEERLLRLYKVPPLMMVGMEGLYGIGLSLSLLTLLQLWPMASWGDQLHHIQEVLWRGSDKVEQATYTNVTWLTMSTTAKQTAVPYDDVIQAFDQMRQSGTCLLAVAIYISAAFLYNACQLTIIKHLSAVATVMLGSLRNITVWGACLLIPSVFDEHFNMVQFIGFIFLVFGNVLFHRVLITQFDQILPTAVVDRCALLLRDPPSPSLEALRMLQESSPCDQKQLSVPTSVVMVTQSNTTPTSH